MPDVSSSEKSPEEKRLIERSQAGDMNAFRTLVERHQRYAYALAFRIVCNESDARDIVQESFIRVWRSLKAFDLDKKFTTWLYRIVVNLACDCMRAEKRKRRLFLVTGEEECFARENGLSDETVCNRDLVEHIRRLADGLPPRQRLVFVLRDLQDMTMEEVAETLHMSMASVKTNLCYARKQIRKRLGTIMD